MRTSNGNMIKYYTVWALMLKIKTHESPGFCFKFFILSRKQQTKLKLLFTHKFFAQVYTHFGSAVKKVQTESRPDWRSVLFSCMGFASLNVPPLTAFKNILIIHPGQFKVIGF